MRNAIMGGFFGCVLAAAFLAACGGSSSTGYSSVTIDELQTRIAELEDLLGHFRRDGNTIVLEGANLQIQNGAGSTDSVNGLGNLIVGYNEAPPTGSGNRTGSHTVVIGIAHEWTSYAGLVAGSTNRVHGASATVTGGTGNTASGPSATVSGGSNNTASGTTSAVGGGSSNQATALCTAIYGGLLGTADADYQNPDTHTP